MILFFLKKKKMIKNVNKLFRLDFINTSFTSQQQFGDPSSYLALAASSDPLASILNTNDSECQSYVVGFVVNQNHIVYLYFLFIFIKNSSATSHIKHNARWKSATKSNRSNRTTKTITIRINGRNRN